MEIPAGIYFMCLRRENEEETKSPRNGHQLSEVFPREEGSGEEESDWEGNGGNTSGKRSASGKTRELLRREFRR